MISDSAYFLGHPVYHVYMQFFLQYEYNITCFRVSRFHVSQCSVCAFHWRLLEPRVPLPSSRFAYSPASY